MAGIGSIVIIRLVTGIAFGGDIREVIDVMTACTFGDGMTFGQGEYGVMHGKLRRFPSRKGGMTLQTVCGDPGCQMVGIGSIVVIRLVTGITFR